MIRILICIAVCLSAVCAFAFEWPQNMGQDASIALEFAQDRGGSINSAVVFASPETVRASDAGEIIAVQDLALRSSSWFPPTLGNAVVLSHKDSLISVNGNLREIAPHPDGEFQREPGSVLGSSGESGWVSNGSALEFQIVDTQNRTIINPAILLPRRAELAVHTSPTPLILVGQNGSEYDLRTERSVPAGSYKVYRLRGGAMPFRTSLSLNGAVVESITFDYLNAERGRVGVMGRGKYGAEMLYPSSDRQFLGELNLTRGRNTLSFTAENLELVPVTQNYTLEVR